MTNHSERLTAVTAEQMAQLQAEADERARMQEILSALPMGLQIESLPDEALVRLREIVRSPVTALCGDSLLLWNNICRARVGLEFQN